LPSGTGATVTARGEKVTMRFGRMAKLSERTGGPKQTRHWPNTKRQPEGEKLSTKRAYKPQLSIAVVVVAVVAVVVVATVVVTVVVTS
jgi:hypothetical protein